MRKYVCVVRTSVVTLGALALAGSFAFERWLSERALDRASQELLFSEDSPFQSARLTGLDATNPPRTELTLRTPSTPFGAGESLTPDGMFEAVIKSGDTFSSLWKRLGATEATGERLVQAFRALDVKIPGLKAGEKVWITRKSGELVEFKRRLGPGTTLILTGGPDGEFVPRIDRARIVRSERRISGIINSSLVDAARGVDLPYDLVDEFVDLFSNRVEFRRDLQPGDTFSVIYDDQWTDDGERIGGATIKAASLRLNGKLYAVVRDEMSDGTVRYFDENGEMPGKFFLRYPVKYTRISSVFSNARFHPVLKVSRPHNGVDFSAPTGTPVRTVGEGVVTFSGYTKSTGYMVRIQHDSRYSTEYLHLSEIEARVKKGARVSRGELIGAVGSTGYSTGPHLHFGMFDGGKYIDPFKSKVMLQPDQVKPPKAVLVMLEDIRKSHEGIRVAEAASGKNV